MWILHVQHISLWTQHVSVLSKQLWLVATILERTALDIRPCLHIAIYLHKYRHKYRFSFPGQRTPNSKTLRVIEYVSLRGDLGAVEPFFINFPAVLFQIMSRHFRSRYLLNLDPTHGVSAASDLEKAHLNLSISAIQILPFLQLSWAQLPRFVEGAISGVHYVLSLYVFKFSIKERKKNAP